jgi:Uma2 family endonuclease
MSALAQHPPRMTPAEFLAWEAEQPERHEFIDGEVYAMTGGTLNHNRITRNLVRSLEARLSPRCEVFFSDVKVQVGTNFFYPDVVVQCGAQDGTSLVLERPVLIAEVGSRSTAKYDRSTKWDHYELLPTLQTYLMVQQDGVGVRLYRRNGAAWLYTTHHTLDEALELFEPPLTFPVRELYARVPGLDPSIPPA